MTVEALDGRVTALDGVKAQLEQQLALEREACAVELGLRQKAEASYAEAQRAAAEAHPLRHEHTDIEEVMTWTDAEEDHQLLGVGGNPGNFDLSKLER